jgi:dUTPase
MFINHNLLAHYPRYMHLRIFVDSFDNPNLYQKYYEAMYNHNSKMNQNPLHIDAGFDLFAPSDARFHYDIANKLDYKIKCSAQIVEGNEHSYKCYNTGYYLHPRSSISKTPLRLANSTGIVDSGYRGNIIGMLDCTIPNYGVEQYDRLVQICAPGLMPINVEVVDKEELLGAPTQRGTGGIGSTGR